MCFGYFQDRVRERRPLLNAKIAGEKNFDFLKSQMEGTGKP